MLDPISVDVALADPPWYPEFSVGFVWNASQIVRLGGTLLLCGPNRGTRPGVQEEWDSIQVYAQSAGFDLISFESSLRYDTPPFEHNSLSVAGHPTVSLDWRTGCLATFVRNRIVALDRPSIPSERLLWEECCIKGIRWRVRRSKKNATASPLLQELVAGDVLDSVSRRDVRRSKAAVWTSGNRVFGCYDTFTLMLILEALSTGAVIDTFIERSLSRQLSSLERHSVDETGRRVMEIVAVEQKEYLRLAEGLSVS
jgi:hypothetical protein